MGKIKAKQDILEHIAEAESLAGSVWGQSPEGSENERLADAIDKMGTALRTLIEELDSNGPEEIPGK